ncbi:electron transport complex subunit RsxC [Ferrimonas pelagia]|uniref:Ion-translocating oxidoreductase complex subunit C n=1 Tax=Ferrimonas pelagia TaxID=1177826 RepID=A0ABP9EAR0_9GAMM
MQTLLEQLDQGQIWTFPGGIHPPERKDLSNTRPIARLPLPPRLLVPVRQHIGAAGNLLVARGDTVLKGQALTQASGAMAVPVHAPTSGIIGEISHQPIAHPSGLSELCIEILTDGEDHWRPRNARTSIQALGKEELHELIRNAGIAGLGGATFPSAVKLSTQANIDVLLINGAECEPYISSDDRLMREHADEILQGIDILIHMLAPKRVLIAIENNKPEAISAFERALAQSHLDPKRIAVREIPTKYPSGSEKQLIQILTGKEVPRGKLPADLGLLMHNVGTCYAIKRAVFDDEPLIERVITVTGEQAGNAGNYWIRLGTPIRWLLEQTATLALKGQPLIMGGPMMGFALPNIDAPVVKATNCLLAPSLSELPAQPAPRNCIRCGECAQVCPQQLLPQQLYWHSQAGEHDKAQELNLFDCIECGACAFVCPSDIPLVEHYRIAKSELKQQAAAAAKAEQAKIRFDARQARLEKEKQERESRHKRASALKPAAQSAGVAAAIAKLKAQKEGAPALKPAPSDNVDMAELRRQRKAQARAAKAAEQGNLATPASSDTAKPADGGRKDAVAAAIARAKAKQAQTPEPIEQASAAPSSADSDPRKAAIAAAVARAKAKQGQGTGVDAASTAAKQPAPADPRKAAIAAAVARAKAKQAADRTEPNAQVNARQSEAQTASTPPIQDKRKAAVAAAIAKAKAKQTAEVSDNQPITHAEPKPAAAAAPEQDKRKAAVAAAIAKAKAKQAAARSETAATDAAETKAKVSDNQPITHAEPEPAVAPEQDKRKAAVAAAIAKAKAKQAAARSETGANGAAEAQAKVSDNQPASHAEAEPAAAPEQDKRKAAVAAAIAKAKAKQAAAANDHQPAAQAEAEPAVAPEQDKRKAAVAAAIAKAKAKQAAAASDRRPPSHAEPEPAATPEQDKRKAAVSAAIAKAKAKQAAARSETGANDAAETQAKVSDRQPASHAEPEPAIAPEQDKRKAAVAAAIAKAKAKQAAARAAKDSAQSDEENQ